MEREREREGGRQRDRQTEGDKWNVVMADITVPFVYSNSLTSIGPTVFSGLSSLQILSVSVCA
jgi:hypothetical protein